MNKQLEELTLDNNVLFVFDFDGTLTEAKFTENGILGCINTDEHLLRRELEYSVYENLKPIPEMQKLVTKLHETGHDIKILTQIHNGIEVLRKASFIQRNFQAIDPNKDLIGVIAPEHKTIALSFFCDRYKKIVYIDDTLSTLINLDEHRLKTVSTLDNLYCFHTSSIFI